MKLEKMSVFVADYFPMKPGRVSVGQLKRHREPARLGHVDTCAGLGRVARPGQIGPGSNNIPSSNLCQSSDQHFMRHSEDLQTVKKPVLRTESGGQ